jgi:hypothetical protein
MPRTPTLLAVARTSGNIRWPPFLCLSGSVEGVRSNPDPYSDSPEPMVVKQPQFTRVEEPTLLNNHVGAGRSLSGYATLIRIGRCLKLVIQSS